MNENKMKNASENELLDRADVRVQHASSLREIIESSIDRIKSGDLGSLPVIVGLIIIWTVFGILNPIFLSPNNLVNLLYDCSTVGMISLGVVCVLLLGEIDLSIGSISGVSSAIIGVLWVNQGWPIGFSILAALSFGGIVGSLYAFLLIKFNMPSFISTLAGLLALLGFQLYLLGSSGSINLPYGSTIVEFGQLMTIPKNMAYILAALPGVVIFISRRLTYTKRNKANLSSPSMLGLIIFVLILTVVLEMIIFYLNQDRGVPWMFALFIIMIVIMDYLITRTKWGRSMLAVGGNKEAARRAGINIKMMYTSAFMLCGMLAATGGMMAAARLASSSQQAGTGDVNLNAIAAAVIGGTSLFGGRGSAYSALLGIIVIQSIASGLTMLNLPSSLRYMITGGVLALAVVVDSLARQSRANHGRA